MCHLNISEMTIITHEYTRILSRRHDSLGYQKHNFPFQICLFIFKVLKGETVRKLRLGECPENKISFVLSASFDFLLAHK